MLTREVLDELERLEKAATKGPWTTEKPHKDEDGWSLGQVVAATARGQSIYANPPGGTFPEADRQLIALLRTHARALIAAGRAQAKGE